MKKYRDGSTFPAAHDTAKEARRRIVVGLAGLVLMLLLVMLTGLLIGQAREEAEVAKAQAEAAGVVNPGGDAAVPPVAADPLASVADTQTPVPAAPVLPGTAGEGVVVPDLQPDPQLKAARSQP